MEIKEGGRVCTKGGYQKPPKKAKITKTTKTIKNHQI